MASVAGSVIRYLRFFKKVKANKVLDYGTGNMRNARFLQDQGFSVYAADLPEQLKRISCLTRGTRYPFLLEAGNLNRYKLNVDLVISTFVLNVIGETTERKNYLNNIIINLRKGGYLLIEVKCREKLTKGRCNLGDEGLCRGCDKSFSRDELDGIVTPYGFKRLGHYYGRYSVGVLYQRNID